MGFNRGAQQSSSRMAFRRRYAYSLDSRPLHLMLAIALGRGVKLAPDEPAQARSANRACSDRRDARRVRAST